MTWQWRSGPIASTIALASYGAFFHPPSAARARAGSAGEQGRVILLGSSFSGSMEMLQPHTNICAHQVMDGDV